jgi:hypothetical protein
MVRGGAAGECGAGDEMCDDDDNDDDCAVQMLWTIPKPLNLPQGISNTFQDLFSLHAQATWLTRPSSPSSPSGSDPPCSDPSDPYPHLKAVEDAVQQALARSHDPQDDIDCFPRQVRQDNFMLRYYTIMVKALLLSGAFTIWTRKGGAGCPGGPDSSHLAPSTSSAHLNMSEFYPCLQQYILSISAKSA